MTKISSIRNTSVSFSAEKPPLSRIHSSSGISTIVACGKSKKESYFSNFKQTLRDFFVHLFAFLKQCLCCKTVLPPQVKKLSEAVVADYPNKTEIINIIDKEFKEGRGELLKMIGKQWVESGLIETSENEKQDILQTIGEKALRSYNPSNQRHKEALVLAVNAFIAKF